MPSSKGNALRAAAALGLAVIAFDASAQIWQQQTKKNPQTTQTPQAQTQQSQQTPQDPEVAKRLAHVQSIAQKVIQVAQLGQQKAQAPAAKNLANQVAKDWQDVLSQLQGLASRRGIALAQDATQVTSQQDLQSVLADLNSKNGAEFDRQFIEYQVSGFHGFEPELKWLRDATPGKDAELKSWLDQTENVVEASLGQARAAKQQVATAK